jgi:hypothetical protein
MTHARQKIRYAVAAALASIPETANRIYPAKRYGWQSDQLPGIAIYTDSATVEYLHRDREQQHTLNLVIECAASATDTVEDDLDDICAAVEVAIEDDPTFGGGAYDSMLASVSSDASTDGERPVSITRLTYSVTYVTPASNPAGLV